MALKILGMLVLYMLFSSLSAAYENTHECVSSDGSSILFETLLAKQVREIERGQSNEWGIKRLTCWFSRTPPTGRKFSNSYIVFNFFHKHKRRFLTKIYYYILNEV